VRQITASAPGKLILVGEYAVLEDGAAVSAAVDLRARVTLTQTAAEFCELKIANSGERFRFSIDSEGVPVWQTLPGDMGDLLQVCLPRVIGAKVRSAAPHGFEIELDTRNFYTTSPAGLSVKAGIGSSAALAVALTAVLQSYCDEEPQLAVATGTHHQFQLGKGSGIDVLTSWYGGVVAVGRQADGPTLTSQLNWLPGLHVMPVWTGVPASTPSMLARLEEFADQQPGPYASLLQQLGDASGAALAQWKSNDVTGFIDRVEQFAVLLMELDAAAHVGIWSDAHQQLQQIARRYGVCYKPSGAGGGDYGLFFTTDPDSLGALKTELERFASNNLRLNWAQQGLELGCQDIAN
jgi:phosphomevalonate kinase